jgi:hypothetical protein
MLSAQIRLHLFSVPSYIFVTNQSIIPTSTGEVNVVIDVSARIWSKFY